MIDMGTDSQIIILEYNAAHKAHMRDVSFSFHHLMRSAMQRRKDIA